MRMTNVRWIFEIRKMKLAFPNFKSFQKGKYAGFQGNLRGTNGKTYVITVQVRGDGYPAQAPQIFIAPHIGSNWLSDGSLCVYRKWNPKEDTFAQQVTYAASYIAQHG